MANKLKNKVGQNLLGILNWFIQTPPPLIDYIKVILTGFSTYYWKLRSQALWSSTYTGTRTHAHTQWLEIHKSLSSFHDTVSLPPLPFPTAPLWNPCIYQRLLSDHWLANRFSPTRRRGGDWFSCWMCCSWPWQPKSPYWALSVLIGALAFEMPAA